MSEVRTKPHEWTVKIIASQLVMMAWLSAHNNGIILPN